MIKPVSVMNSIVKTPAVRNFATATMLTLGVLGVGACAGGNSNKTTDKAQTELISQEGAEALKNNIIKANTISYTHNKKIEDYLNVAFPDAVKEEDVNYYKSVVYNIAEEYGTFLSTMEAQRLIDFCIAEQAIKDVILVNGIRDGVIDDFSQYDKLKTIKKYAPMIDSAEKIIEWADGEYYQALLKKGGLEDVSGEAISTKLDEFLEEQKYLTQEEKDDYYTLVKNYQKKQIDKKRYKVQNLADLISLKMNKINELVFLHKIGENEKFISTPKFDYIWNSNYDPATPLFY